MASKPEVAVVLQRPGPGPDGKGNKIRVLKRFTTVRRAEKYIAQRERIDPTGVHRGDYGIDANAAAQAAYDRLRNRGGSK